MLLANLAKHDSTLRILKLKRAIPKPLSSSPMAIDQLMDCFVKGAGESFNNEANYDYLSYFFADLAKVWIPLPTSPLLMYADIDCLQHPECRAYFLSPQPTDNNIIPLSKLLVFTESTSHIRRLGVASTIKNLSFDVSAHPKLLAPHYPSSAPEPLLTIASSDGAAQDQDAEQATSDPLNLLPYILLPLCGPSAADFSAEDMDDMLEDLQFLPSEKKRESDKEILKTHLETLLLLTTSKEGRETLRKVKVYPVVRELHVGVEDEGVREGVDRLVQVLMRDEEGEEGEKDEKMDAGGLLIGQEGESEKVEEVDSDAGVGRFMLSPV